MGGRGRNRRGVRHDGVQEFNPGAQGPMRLDQNPSQVGKPKKSGGCCGGSKKD